MANTTQGFAALLDVYVRQYRAQVSAELNSVKSNFRTVDNIAVVDKDITALALVCDQVDKLLMQGTASFAQARMVTMLVAANAAALKTHMPMVEAADLRYISGPNVAVLDQARLKVSAKRLQDIDDTFLANVNTTVDAVQKAMAATFDKPDSQPQPQPDPGPMPVPDPTPEPTPIPEPRGFDEDGDGLFENLSAPTGPSDMFNTPPSPLDRPLTLGPSNGSDQQGNDDTVPSVPL